ncbi:MAG: efflux RND transporter permease subunit [Pseudomonadota bacterium]|nr:efflux RND transporter permease subunit [Pseudomonadota bacterium]
MSRFFIDRPIFAWVIAIIMMLAGILSMLKLPIAQYPEIAPPTIAISANYPGASAKTVEDTVTQIIEQRMKGLDGLMYMSSSSSGNGSASINLSFVAGTDPDIAQVQVQNKLQAAMSQLPQEVQRQGVTVNKSARNFLLVLGFVSEDGSMDRNDIADYVTSSVVDPLSRVEGVGEIQVFGSPYAMRIWLDPAKLASYQLTASDITAAIQAQNAQVSAGQLGGAPALAGQQLNATVTAQTRLQTPEEFRNILLKTGTDGSQVRLSNVATVELGGESYEVVSRYNGNAAAGLGIKLAAGANALSTRDAVLERMEQMKTSFPQGLDVVAPYDTTPFVRLSIEGVVHTLAEAIVLVFLVMYLFLQNWRATIIPTLAVPVVLLGTFAVFNLLGFSINTLTLFGMVLAIGLLVDDAIVVVENVERLITEEGLSPREATYKSMNQITGALIGIGLVLSAVFIPMAFFGGSVGVIYQQFSVALVSCVLLSVVIALILTPALCATLLKPVHTDPHQRKGFFGWFNRKFDHAANRYQSTIGRMLHKSLRYGLIYLGIIALMGFLFVRLPTAFLPDEDQGLIFTLVQLPAGATQERTLETMKKVEDYYLNEEKETVQSVFAITGFSFAGSGQNMGLAFVRLKDWDERKGAGQDVQSVAGRAMGAFSQLNDAMVFAIVPPSVVELGNANGFDLQLQDSGNIGHQALLDARNMLLGMAAQNPKLVGVRPNGQEDTPQYKVNVNQEQAGAMGVSLSEINNVLATGWGGSYVNDFIDRGRVKRVYMQGQADARSAPEDLNKWYVRGNAGQMVPFSAFATGEWTYGAPKLDRYNGLSSFNIQGAAAAGVSSGEAMDEIEKIIEKLPDGVSFEWSGLSLEEKMSSGQTPLLYSLSLLVVFLCLAALYESWSIPFAVMMVVPLGVLGAVLATLGRDLSNDVYFQVGLLTVVGLAAKNAILIVEFAKDLQEQGKPLIASVLEAVRIRVRPIIMTSLAFGLGVLPLALSTGAGSGSQNAIGTGVLGGMLGATILGIFFIPLFYFWVRSLFKYTPHPEDQPPVSVEKS